MPQRRVIIPVVVLLLFGALFIACGFLVLPYVIKQMLDTVSKMNITAIKMVFKCTYHLYHATCSMHANTVNDTVILFFCYTRKLTDTTGLLTPLLSHS